MAEITDSASNSVSEVIGDEELIKKVRNKLGLLANQLRLAHEQGNIIEQRLVRYETLYERTTREAIRSEFRLKLAIYNEVKSMFFHYAERCFTKMKKLEGILDFLVETSPPSLTSDLGGMRLEDAVDDLDDVESEEGSDELAAV